MQSQANQDAPKPLQLLLNMHHVICYKHRLLLCASLLHSDHVCNSDRDTQVLRERPCRLKLRHDPETPKHIKNGLRQSGKLFRGQARSQEDCWAARILHHSSPKSPAAGRLGSQMLLKEEGETSRWAKTGFTFNIWRVSSVISWIKF